MPSTPLRSAHCSRDRSGVLWIGTIGGGLSRLNVVEKHIECYTEAQGLCENRIITFLEARDGILWVSTHGGINLFNRSSATFRELRINGLPSINLQPYQPSLWPKTATSGSERGTKDCGSSTAGISTGRYRPVRSGPTTQTSGHRRGIVRVPNR